MQHKNIHWFPGHMQKALREIVEKIKIIDVVIELLDARAPFSSRNNLLHEATSHKKKLIVLTKTDIADPRITAQWSAYFKEHDLSVLPLDLKSSSATQLLRKHVVALGQDKREKEIKKGMKPQAIRAMIIGIPNVGKSTLINSIAKKASASVQNTPGHTKAQQWIKVDNDFELLDTPGILPMVYKEKKIAENLALLGSIKQNILPLTALSEVLMNFLRVNYLDLLKKRYAIEINDNDTNQIVFSKIAQKRGLLSKEGYDYNKVEILLIKEFRNGIIGPMSLEKVEENHA